ncbi:MAG TPA: PAS domain-containing sensor histidine kinase [Candidatus Nitrosotalea sp.]|nr:PAS domain-containing sensor histidine kinase [Candidatus Nitrosotalea sp.]
MADLSLYPVEMPVDAFEALIAWIPGALVMIDSDQRITAVNEKAAKLFGYRLSELVGRSLNDLVPVTAREIHGPVVEGFLKRPHVRHPHSGLRLSARRKDGTEFPVDISLSTLSYPDGLRAIAVVTDATDREERVRADEQKRQLVNFWSVVSHELRNPLNAVLGFAQLLGTRRTENLTVEQHKWVDIIHRSGSHMLELLNEVVELQQAKSGRSAVLWEQVGVDSVIDEVLESIETDVEAKGLYLEREGARGLSILGSQRRLWQISVNLIANAVKYTDEGKVRVLTERAGGMVKISVADSGPGMPEAECKQAFEPFFRGSLAVRQAKSGMGLGLALVKELVESMDGTISLESVENLGTTATVTFPAA